MQPVQITYHGFEPSPALTELIHERTQQLERVSDRIHSVRVLVDAPHQHRHKGNHYRVRIALTMPGCDLVVGHDDDDRVSDEDAYQAVRHAFDALRRQLDESVDRRHAKQRARR